MTTDARVHRSARRAGRIAGPDVGNINGIDRATAAADRALGRRPLLMHLAALGVNLAVLVYVGRQQWFFADDWGPVADRSAFGSTDTIGWLTPHNEHPFILPTFLWRSMIRLFGLGSYLPFVMMAVLSQLLLTHLLWRLLLRVGTRASVATCVAFVFGMCGAAYENLLWAFQSCLSLSLVFGVAALLVLPLRGPLRPRDAAVVLLLCASWMCSGVGLVVILVVVATAALSGRWAAAALDLVVPLGLLGAWALRYGQTAPDGTQSTIDGILSAPKFAMSGMVAAFGAFVDVKELGAVLLALVVVGVVYACRREVGSELPALTMFAGAVAFLVFAAVKRSDLGGFSGEGGSRYFHVVLALSLPAIALAIDGLLRIRPMRLAASALLVMVTVVQINVLTDAAEGWADRAELLHRRVDAAALIIDRGDRFFDDRIDADSAPALQSEELARLIEDGSYPAPARVRQADELDAQNQLEIALVPVGQDLVQQGGVMLLGTNLVESTEVTPGCQRLEAISAGATVALIAPRPASTEVDVDLRTTVEVQTATDTTFEHKSSARPVEFPTGRSELVLAGTDRVVLLTMPAGSSIELCELDP